jgi:hypothetical protein
MAGPGVKREASLDGIEILKFPVGLGAQRSVVLDGTDSGWPTVSPGASRTLIPEGTILKQSVTNPDKHVKYNGSGTITGILGRTVDLVANATNGSIPANEYWFGCVFVTKAIQQFTNYASALVADLKFSTFEGKFE